MLKTFSLALIFALFSYQLHAGRLLSACLKLMNGIRSDKQISYEQLPYQATYHTLLDDYIAPSMSNPDSPLLVSILGPGNMGKSTLFNHLISVHPDRFEVVSPIENQIGTTRGLALATHKKLSVVGVESSEDLENRVLLGDMVKAERSTDITEEGHYLVSSSPQIPEKMVLVDAPEFNSLNATNYLQAQKVLRSSEVIIYFLGPQNYADAQNITFLKEMLNVAGERKIILIYREKKSRLTHKKSHSEISEHIRHFTREVYGDENPNVIKGVFVMSDDKEFDENHLNSLEIYPLNDGLQLRDLLKSLAKDSEKIKKEVFLSVLEKMLEDLKRNYVKQKIRHDLFQSYEKFIDEVAYHELTKQVFRLDQFSDNSENLKEASFSLWKETLSPTYKRIIDLTEDLRHPQMFFIKRTLGFLGMAPIKKMVKSFGGKSGEERLKLVLGRLKNKLQKLRSERSIFQNSLSGEISMQQRSHQKQYQLFLSILKNDQLNQEKYIQEKIQGYRRDPLLSEVIYKNEDSFALTVDEMTELLSKTHQSFSNYINRNADEFLGLIESEFDLFFQQLKDSELHDELLNHIYTQKKKFFGRLKDGVHSGLAFCRPVASITLASCALGYGLSRFEQPLDLGYVIGGTILVYRMARFLTDSFVDAIGHFGDRAIEKTYGPWLREWLMNEQLKRLKLLIEDHIQTPYMEKMSDELLSESKSELQAMREQILFYERIYQRSLQEKTP